jgi:hypothetical protein
MSYEEEDTCHVQRLLFCTAPLVVWGGSQLQPSRSLRSFLKKRWFMHFMPPEGSTLEHMRRRIHVL